MAQEPIWPGSGSAVSGNTPFGFYDDESDYQTDGLNLKILVCQKNGIPNYGY